MSVITLNIAKEPDLFQIEIRVNTIETVYDYSAYNFAAIVTWSLAVALTSDRIAEIVQLDWERQVNGGAWTPFISLSPAYSLEDTTVTTSGVYKYRVRILDTGGIYSPYSNEVTINFTKITATPPIAAMKAGAGATYFSTGATTKPSFPTAPVDASDVIFGSFNNGYLYLNAQSSSAQAGIATYFWEILSYGINIPTLDNNAASATPCRVNNLTEPTETQEAYIKVTITDTQGQSTSITTQMLY